MFKGYIITGRQYYHSIIEALRAKGLKVSYKSMLMNGKQVYAMCVEGSILNDFTVYVNAGNNTIRITSAAMRGNSRLLKVNPRRFSNVDRNECCGTNRKDAENFQVVVTIGTCAALKNSPIKFVERSAIAKFFTRNSDEFKIVRLSDKKNITSFVTEALLGYKKDTLNIFEHDVLMNF